AGVAGVAARTAHAPPARRRSRPHVARPTRTLARARSSLYPDDPMIPGTPFHPRTEPLNRKRLWREWAGLVAAAQYADGHDIEYAAIREAAALIDVSPLYKVRLRGPDALRLVDRVIVRDASRLDVGRVFYTCWCDDDGKVIDDGTVACVAPDEIRWTAADPQYRWLRLNAAGLDVEIEDVTESLAALAVQGPLSRAVVEAAIGESLADLGYFRCRSATVRTADGSRVAVDVSRTGYTGDLGYELWIPAADAPAVWDALVAAGEPYRARPVGLAALDVARLEAGLILLEVDYTSSRRALVADQTYSPFEIGLGRLVDLRKPSFVGRRALVAEQARGGPPRRLVGLVLDWPAIEALYAEHGLPPVAPAAVDRSPTPVFDATGRQVGRLTSHGWSPLLKQVIGLASVGAAHAAIGTRLAAEWTVEGRRGRVAATVVPLPFLDLERKRA
ncbi:MAG TPA: aminomethyltransferase family protein, partial [Candidatus Limnocylindrales bacterium]|nr:aminomethyltransferase family protein [Candidatus Limnocylindrales bacterium]